MRKLAKNPDITEKAAERGVFYYEVAERMGIADTTFSRWLRKPVAEELREKILKAIDDISNKKSS